MSTTQKVVIGVVALAALLFANTARATSGATVAALSYLGQKGLPRGMRNNNPGNIRISANAWKGKVPAGQNTDGAFEQFSTYAYGIRAMIKNLLTYYSRGIRTLHDIIYTWAPPADGNDSATYVDFVAQRTGLPKKTALNLTDKATMQKLVLAMSEMENGRKAVTPEQFAHAWSIV